MKVLSGITIDDIPVPKHRKDIIYTLYRGDDIVAVGTLDELHRKTGLTIRSLLWYTTPSARKREQSRKKGGVVLVEG